MSLRVTDRCPVKAALHSTVIPKIVEALCKNRASTILHTAAPEDAGVPANLPKKQKLRAAPQEAGLHCTPSEGAGTQKLYTKLLLPDTQIEEACLPKPHMQPHSGWNTELQQVRSCSRC